MPKAIMQLVASEDLATFTEAHKDVSRIQKLTKSKINHCCSTSIIEQKDDTVNQINGNGTQNLYCRN